ncbi:diguanylate cyclase [Pseudobdellovibrio sp. HCB154]|uniref:tetratricopeptide repeat-containing diguanylate cyclase n=1 Tax=Pseudobdellovibrio sp. HCB154 TaxID=3386277 RepID=UPI00391721BC
MRFALLVSLILWVNSTAFASSTAALKILESADELAGDNPKASLELLASIDKTIPVTEIDVHLRKNILKCEILVDNDDPREALKISERVLSELNIKSELGLKMRLCRSSALEGIGESVKAETELIKTLSESRGEGFREVEGQAHLKLGQIQSFKNQFSSSLKHLTSAKQIFSSLNLAHKERITLNSIAVLYGRMGENEKAITYFEEVLAQNKSLGKNRNIAVVLYNIGRRYEDLKKYDKALDYLNDSLKIHSEMKNEKSLAVVERALGGVYNSIGKPEEALKHLSNALGTLERKNLVKSQAQLHLEFGKTYTLMKKPKEALASLAKAEELNAKSFSQQLASDIFQARSQVFESTGQWKQAFESISELKKSSDSLFKMKADEQLNRMNALFDVEMLQKELSNSQRVQNLQLLALALAAGLLIFGVIFTIKQIKMARAMRALALTDEMTKIPNRRHIIEYGKQMLNTCQRQDKALSVVIFDIDHFKKINDTFGHAVGDEVIKKVAFIGRNSLRQEDMIGRIGGEEFLAILPFTGAEAAREVAERIRLHIQKYNFSNIAENLQVTVSVGVVTQELPRGSVSLDQLIHDADEALYNVKQNGRNGVSLRLIS